MNDQNNVNLFVHFSAIISDGFQSLVTGQKVMFDTECDVRNSSKIMAVNVLAV